MKLHNYIKLIKGIKRLSDGFFLMAENFYNLATNIDESGVVKSYCGWSLRKRSQEESFFAVFMNRFRGNGPYILDELEAALSSNEKIL